MRSRTTPACGATRACSIFIASTTARRWPASTLSPSRTASAATRPVIGARIAEVALFRGPLGLRKRVDELDERLPAAGEGVHPAIRLVERDLVPRLEAAAIADAGVGALDEMQASGDAVDRHIEADPARAHELERVGDPPRIVRSQRRCVASGAFVGQQERGGVDGAPVGRMRLSAEAPEIGVDEAGVHRSGRELRAAHERLEEGEIGLRSDDDGVVELLQHGGQRLCPGGSVNDELGDHRVVVGRDAIARSHAGVDPDALQPLLALEVQETDPAGGGQKVVLGSSA